MAVGKNPLRLGAQGRFHAVYHLHRQLRLRRFARHIGIHDEPRRAVHRRHRRIVRSVAPLFVGHHRRIGVRHGNLRRLGVLAATLLATLVDDLRRGNRLAQRFPSLLQRRQLGRQLVRRRAAEQGGLPPVGLVHLGQRRSNLRVQRRQPTLQRLARTRLVSAAVGLDTRAVQANLHQPHQAHTHRQVANLAEQGLERVGETDAKVAERRMIDGPPGGQPQEVQ